MEDFFVNLEVMHPKCIINVVKGGLLPKKGMKWEFTNEIKAVDLYCYFHGKYGPPNGLLNIFKSPSSDNLIHWEWTFATEYGLLSILGMNFRTEVMFRGDYPEDLLTKEMFLSQIKSDMKNHGKSISAFRKNIETWTQFVNPYHRIRKAVDQNFIQLEALDIDPQRDRIHHPRNSQDTVGFEDRWRAISARYSAAVGLVFGLRAMLPVMAESFVNLLFFMRAREEIKSNPVLFQRMNRLNLDIRIQTLHLNCNGFKKPIDYSSPECKAFSTLINERNGLLHGNVEVDKLSVGDIYFHENTPLFKQYDDFWSLTIGTSMQSVRFATIREDFQAIENFIEHVIQHLDESAEEEIRFATQHSLLGENTKTGKVGILLPEGMADFHLRFAEGATPAAPEVDAGDQIAEATDLEP
ncbi:hypothetical protein [Pseudomonas kurunegalensis]|uniref:hypothetical protein n=1 Tax=Pseudomonas kurunegalensis TaxID=485880 RepID=UPI002570B6E4|nr:hypothetical protein [Pseudomonas kurunegalensis]WJD63097.1 hypothetical protein QQ992_02005 [Pseudomonas kurunegalensis]